MTTPSPERERLARDVEAILAKWNQMNADSPEEGWLQIADMLLAAGWVHRDEAWREAMALVKAKQAEFGGRDDMTPSAAALRIYMAMQERSASTPRTGEGDEDR